MIGGIILLTIALIAWFGMAKNASEESATGFVRIFKSIFGMKGYIIMAKFIAILFLLAALAEFYKYFTE
ncbi:hypothetical protein [Aquimarina mytili]|uniref:Uncharacterized protein n=1 Tax=Aquimarina mytili TaxID=874423 RepID=A0A937DB70_9FLAO|nr:hypothetical protein [Aquimarina mytili]MBL0685452.1 hypothetical protein [Aquimarina mytili]